MISVIVPVYNVENYLRKCLDSVVHQTYRDLEILIVDDGSTDGSGGICDEYRRDPRVTVFHTENRGLSAARNLALDRAAGDWIGFVDSDDRIEPEMFEALLKGALENGADVAECGYFYEYASSTVPVPARQGIIPAEEAAEALIRGMIQTRVWNKLYRKTCFAGNRFPVGRCFEDIATTHKLVQNCKVAGVPGCFYHYLQRGDSISQRHDAQNLIDYWLSYRQRYEDLKGHISKDAEAQLLKECASAIARTWVWYLKSTPFPAYINEMSGFARDHFSLFGEKGWPVYLRICAFLARFRNKASYATAYGLNQLYRRLKPKYYG